VHNSATVETKPTSFLNS